MQSQFKPNMFKKFFWVQFTTLMGVAVALVAVATEKYLRERILLLKHSLSTSDYIKYRVYN